MTSNDDKMRQIRKEIERSIVNKEKAATEYAGDGYVRFYNMGLSKALKIIDKYMSQ